MSTMQHGSNARRNGLPSPGAGNEGQYKLKVVYLSLNNYVKTVTGQIVFLHKNEVALGTLICE